MFLILRPTITGRENVPATGPFIIASNHLSFIDSMAIPLMAPRRVGYLAKAEYFTGPGIGGGLGKEPFNAPGGPPGAGRRDPAAPQGPRNPPGVVRARGAARSPPPGPP